MEKIDTGSKLFKSKTIIVLSLLLYFISWIAAGVYVTFLGLTDRKFDVISPPTALFGGSWDNLNLYFRLTDYFIKSSNLLLVIVGVFIPILVFVLSVYFFKIGRSLMTAVKWSIFNLFLIYASCLIFMFTVPGTIEWSVYWAKAQIDTINAKKMLSDANVVSDVDKIIAEIGLKKYKVYPDYGIAGGSILSKMISLRNGEKLTYYESFYLPIFLAERDIKTGISKIDDSKVIILDGESIIFGRNIDKDNLKKVLLPLAQSIIKNGYYKHTAFTSDKLKNFIIIDDDEFNTLYKFKNVANLKGNLSKLKGDYSNNKSIIDNYQNVVKKNNLDYQKEIADQEKKYQDGCVKSSIYINCEQLRQVIDKNSGVIAKNKEIALADYNSAIMYNRQIDADIVSVNKRIVDMDSGVASVENSLGELSMGVSFDSDTIYMRFVKDNPVSSDYVRVAVHELLHAYSYSAYKSLPKALDESLTDYLTAKALGYNDLDSIRAAGYSLEIQIVFALLERITLDDLMDCYFNKDEEKFKKLMAENFPDTNYNEFIKKYDELLEGTYHLNGAYHSFDKSLIDHSDVRAIRKILGLPEIKFENTIY